MRPRLAEPIEIDALAQIWFDGWHDAHDALLPAEFAEDRTLESFTRRLPKYMADLRTIGEPGVPRGLSITIRDELNQFYVGADWRGKGVAQPLMEEVEMRLAEGGVQTAWLACAIGNDRAARFYEKCGWHMARTFQHRIELSSGPIDFDVWRYEKHLQVVN